MEKHLGSRLRYPPRDRQDVTNPIPMGVIDTTATYTPGYKDFGPYTPPGIDLPFWRADKFGSKKNQSVTSAARTTHRSAIMRP